MRVFQIFELIIIIALVYLLGNLIKYFFFKGASSNKLFALANMWAAADEEKRKGGGDGK